MNEAVVTRGSTVLKKIKIDLFAGDRKLFPADCIAEYKKTAVTQQRCQHRNSKSGRLQIYRPDRNQKVVEGNVQYIK